MAEVRSSRPRSKPLSSVAEVLLMWSSRPTSNRSLMVEWSPRNPNRPTKKARRFHHKRQQPAPTHTQQKPAGVSRSSPDLDSPSPAQRTGAAPTASPPAGGFCGRAVRWLSDGPDIYTDNHSENCGTAGAVQVTLAPIPPTPTSPVATHRSPMPRPSTTPRGVVIP